MKPEFIDDMISQKILLEDISAIRKKQLLELTASKNIEVFEQRSELCGSKPSITQGAKLSKKHIIILFLVATSFIVTVFLVDDFTTFDSGITMQTKYMIQNLRGDTTETWVSWNIAPSRVLTFTMLGESNISTEKVNAIKDSILSEKTLQIDNSVLHKDIKGTFSTYYMGWQGAMKQASKNPTKMYIPQKFQYIEPTSGMADITINLDTEKNGDGYSGYTKSTVDDNQILKSVITIYDVKELSVEQISTITRHEFGHVLGLAHSTATEDLMYPTINTAYPYISSCDIDAMKLLYDGKNNSEVTCEI